MPPHLLLPETQGSSQFSRADKPARDAQGKPKKREQVFYGVNENGVTGINLPVGPVAPFGSW
jgi:hypothetical protein